MDIYSWIYITRKLKINIGFGCEDDILADRKKQRNKKQFSLKYKKFKCSTSVDIRITAIF